MAATTQDLTKSIVALQEDLHIGSSPVIKDYIKVSGVTSSNPTDVTNGTTDTNASSLVSATVAAAGVAVGDIVLGVGVVSGLATNQFLVNAYVSATDVITLIIGNLVGTNVTTTAVVVNAIVADVT